MAKVFVALSGGVDSSVAAFLLKKAGYEVSGVFMKFWHDPRFIRENACCSLESERRARIVAKNLKIPFLIFDFKKEFKKEIVDDYLKQTGLGLTPNPCVVCNKKIKLGMFLEKALQAKADFVATGHYARRREIKNQKSKIKNINQNLKIKLLKAEDREKDQSYFLYRLSQKQLSKVIFPLGGHTKKEARKLAEKYGLPTAKNKESQDLCFLSTDPADFFKSYLKTKPGQIIFDKQIIGKHQGLAFYTIGQRQGIGPFLFAKEKAKGPYYVLKKDTKKNELMVTRNQKELFSSELMVKNLNFISGKPKFPLKTKAKIRSRQKEVAGILYKNNVFKFNKPQRAVTPGQSIVFYKGEELLGGGVICGQ